MPQTYIRAVGPGAVGRTCAGRGVVQPQRQSPARAGRGRAGAGQACTVGDPNRRGVRTAARGSPASPRPGRAAGPRQQPVDPAAAWRAPRRRVSSSAERGAEARRRGRSRRRVEHLDVSAAASGSPAQPHSTVRSLGSTWNDTPWSTPCTAPSGTGSTWPPLRSALLSDDVEHRHPAQPRVVGVGQHHRLAAAARARRGRAASRSGSAAGAMTSTSVDRRRRLSTHSWHHARAERPVAQDGRRHDVPAGRLGHGVRRDLAARPACRRGSPTAAAPPRPACRRSAACDAVELDLAEQRGVGRVDQPALDGDLAVLQQVSALPTSSAVTGPQSGPVATSAAVAVGARADVPARVERAAAERAGRAAGRHDGRARA